MKAPSQPVQPYPTGSPVALRHDGCRPVGSLHGSRFRNTSSSGTHPRLCLVTECRTSRRLVRTPNCPNTAVISFSPHCSGKPLQAPPGLLVGPRPGRRAGGAARGARGVGTGGAAAGGAGSRQPLELGARRPVRYLTNTLGCPPEALRPEPSECRCPPVDEEPAAASDSWGDPSVGDEVPERPPDPPGVMDANMVASSRCKRCHRGMVQ